MKRFTTFTLVAGLLACRPFAVGWSASQAQQRPDPSPTLRQEQPQQPEVKTFTGRITKNGQKFVLEDSSTKASYQLDDQKKAQQYQGKNVRVTGTLDADNNTIHVQSIEEAV